MAALLALAASRTALASAPSAQWPTSSGDLDLRFPAPAAPMPCSSPESSLADLLATLSESTGVLYTVADARVASALQEARASSVPTSPIAAADVYTFVESQLVAHDFYLMCDRAVTPTTVSVRHRRLSSPTTQALLQVASDELGFVRRHPALLFATTIHVEHLELRTLSPKLHSLLDEDGAASVGIVPIGFSRTVALIGEGRLVAKAVDLLRKLDAESGASMRSSDNAPAPSVLELAFPAPSGALHVPAGASSLAELLASLSRATGVTYTVAASEKKAFEAAQLSLRQSITLQPAEAYAWIESQLLEHGFGLTCDANSRPATAQVRSAKSSAAADADCLSVGVGDLDFVRRHPALGFTTTLKVENLDARVLPPTLRGLLPFEPREGALTPGSDLHFIALRGHGRFVAQTAVLVQRFDVEAARTVTGPTPDDRVLELREPSKR
jgi:hypothetical protein